MTAELTTEEQPGNICPHCSGVLAISYTIEFQECRPHSIRVDPQPMPDGEWTLCPGHPEPVGKHDGTIAAEQTSDAFMVATLIMGWGNDENKYVFVERQSDRATLWFTPKQALSLLDWLQQEKATLQRLAKEQEV